MLLRSDAKRSVFTRGFTCATGARWAWLLPPWCGEAEHDGLEGEGGRVSVTFGDCKMDEHARTHENVLLLLLLPLIPSGYFPSLSQTFHTQYNYTCCLESIFVHDLYLRCDHENDTVVYRRKITIPKKQF